MHFLTSFVFVALVVQIGALLLLAICLGSKAIHRAVTERWQRLTGRRPHSNHGS
jgi:hypothetical protein